MGCLTKDFRCEMKKHYNLQDMSFREIVSIQIGTYEMHLKNMSVKATDMSLTL